MSMILRQIKQLQIKNHVGTVSRAWEREKLVLKSFMRGWDSGRTLIDCERKIFAKHIVKKRIQKMMSSFASSFFLL